jgi:hypothetical protein
MRLVRDEWKILGGAVSLRFCPRCFADLVGESFLCVINRRLTRDFVREFPEIWRGSLSHVTDSRVSASAASKLHDDFENLSFEMRTSNRLR